MHVPETTMDQNRLAPERENEVRPARKPTVMKHVSITRAMKQPSDDHLGLRVLALNRGHVAAALLGSQNVGQLTQ